MAGQCSREAGICSSPFPRTSARATATSACCSRIQIVMLGELRCRRRRPLVWGAAAPRLVDEGAPPPRTVARPLDPAFRLELVHEAVHSLARDTRCAAVRLTMSGKGRHTRQNGRPQPTILLASDPRGVGPTLAIPQSSRARGQPRCAAHRPGRGCAGLAFPSATHRGRPSHHPRWLRPGSVDRRDRSGTSRR